jgi:hypothetical protein
MIVVNPEFATIRHPSTPNDVPRESKTISPQSHKDDWWESDGQKSLCALWLCGDIALLRIITPAA